MKHGFELHTKVYDNGQIHQDLFSVSHGHTHRVQSSMVDTAEAQLRQALILLGWKPPETPGTVDVPLDLSTVKLVSAATPPTLTEAVLPGQVGARLAHEVMITSSESAGQALNHMAEACREDLQHQGMALQDFAIPALRWALLRVATLESDMRRMARHQAVRPQFSDSHPAPLAAR